MNESKFFFCYSADLARILKSKGFNYITRAKHYATNREFTLFEYQKDMQPIINEWNNRKS